MSAREEIIEKMDFSTGSLEEAQSVKSDNVTIDEPVDGSFLEMDRTLSIASSSCIDEPVDGSFLEMATIAIDEGLNINVNVELERLGTAYFKVMNARSFRTATKAARLHFKDSGIEYNRGGGKQPWILDSKDIKHIVSLLNSPHSDHPGYTNWQVACYQWNFENDLIDQNMKDYFDGKYDHMYDDDSRLREAYVPSTQEMPEGWIYN